MKNKAFLFPGQGAQYAGMGKDFASVFAVARETFEEADEILGFHLSKIIFEGPEDVLVQTKYSQPAIFVNSIAILRVILQQLPEMQPFATAGLSLGEYSALCAANKMSFQETLMLVAKRAQFMNEACEKVPGTMAAVLGLSPSQIQAPLEGIEGIWVANYNCPGQIVISGTQAGVQKATEVLKANGAKRVLPLSVSGAFHSGLMQIAQDLLAPHVLASAIQESKTQIVMNAVGNFVESPEEIRKQLIHQVTQSVRWEQGIQAMQEKGVDFYLEIGCGKTLTGMNRKIGPSGPTMSVEKIVDLEELAKQVEGGVQCNC